MSNLDWLMLAMVILVLCTSIDYNAMDMQDIILVVCIVAWVIMQGIRIYIENFRNKN